MPYEAAAGRWVSLLGLGIGVVMAASAGGCMEAAAPPPAPKKRAEAGPKRTATAPANGFNDRIAWRTLDDGLRESADDGRPLMLLVHASWCKQCKKLKPKFQDQRLEQLSERFVMVNVDQDQTPQSLQYAPDGTYIPRILFLDPETGEPDPAMENKARARNRYFYSTREDLVSAMQKALARYGSS